MKSRVLLLVSFAFVALAGFSVGGAPFRVSGAETMREFGDRLTEWYAKKHPSVQFQVTSARATDSFTAMANGRPRSCNLPADFGRARNRFSSFVRQIRADNSCIYSELEDACS